MRMPGGGKAGSRTKRSGSHAWAGANFHHLRVAHAATLSKIEYAADGKEVAGFRFAHEGDSVRKGEPWRGVFSILQTPFGDDLRMDLGQLAREVRYCIDLGAHGLVYPVMASESQTLDYDERISGIESVLGACQGRVPVVAGVTGATAEETLRYAEHVSSAGADAIVCMPPPDRSGSEDDLVRFFQQVSKMSGVPVVIQNASPPLGTPISVPLMARLVQEIEGVRYVKEEVLPSTHRISEILNTAGPSLLGVFGGRAGLHLMDELHRGAAGVFPGASWVDFHLGIVNAYFDGHADEARRQYNRLLPAVNMAMLLGVGFTKHVLVRRGVLTSANCRDGSPMLDADDQRELDEIWAELQPSIWDG